jgi:hypothetical protein
MKVDFVVVACSRDFELLKLQARSVGQFLDSDLVNQFIIIIFKTSHFYFFDENIDFDDVILIVVL